MKLFEGVKKTYNLNGFDVVIGQKVHVKNPYKIIKKDEPYFVVTFKKIYKDDPKWFESIEGSDYKIADVIDVEEVPVVEKTPIKRTPSKASIYNKINDLHAQLQKLNQEERRLYLDQEEEIPYEELQAGGGKVTDAYGMKFNTIYNKREKINNKIQELEAKLNESQEYSSVKKVSRFIQNNDPLISAINLAKEHYPNVSDELDRLLYGLNNGVERSCILEDFKDIISEQDTVVFNEDGIPDSYESDDVELASMIEEAMYA